MSTQQSWLRVARGSNVRLPSMSDPRGAAHAVPKAGVPAMRYRRLARDAAGLHDWAHGAALRVGPTELGSPPHHEVSGA